MAHHLRNSTEDNNFRMLCIGFEDEDSQIMLVQGCEKLAECRISKKLMQDNISGHGVRQGVFV